MSLRAILVTTAAVAGLSLPVAVLRAAQTAPLPLVGVVYDPTGAVMPGVELALEDAQEFKWQAVTDAAGRFEFPPVQPGQYKLEARLPGFRQLRHEFALKTAADWDRAITLEVGHLSETIHVKASRVPASRSSAQGPAPVRVGGNIKAPLKIRDVHPVFPVSMREAGREGVVPLEAAIGGDGLVRSVRVLSAQVHPDFAMAAIDAVRQWRFTPTLLNGAAVDVVMTVTVTFSLSD